MVHAVVDGTYRQTNLTNESSSYFDKREDLRLAEIELLSPIWHFMDLTPQGRRGWYASLAYGTKVHAAAE
jgi:predicted dithiol-disulfide oxidoreductase (DUF899 family)